MGRPARGDVLDLVVVGGGNALPVAAGAARAGLRTALVADGPLGGTCPNEGCIPSKALLARAAVARGVREAGRFHVRATLGGVDGPSLLREVLGAARRTDAEILAGLPPSLDLVRGRAVFTGDRTIRAAGRTLRARRVVIATGSRAAAPAGPVLRGLPWWTSADVFRMERLPRSITVVGGGYVAAEMATFFRDAGVATTVVVRGGGLLDREDGAARAVFGRGFAARVPVLLRTVVAAALHDRRGFRLVLRGPGGKRTPHRSEALLVAIGRVPATAGLGLGRAGVRTGARGNVIVDGRLRTSAPGVFALGDCNGRHAFTHTAAAEAAYLLRVLLEGETAPLDTGPVPHAVFSVPEVAGVGATGEELLAAGTPHVRASATFLETARGQALRERHGLCTLLLAPDGRILGCHIVGHEAAALLHVVLPVLRWRNRVSSLTGFLTVHPSLAEVVALAASRGEALLAEAREGGAVSGRRRRIARRPRTGGPARRRGGRRTPPS